MAIFSPEESWTMSEPQKVAALIREVGLWRLGNWDGCCCSRFSIRNVDVDISCGKGRDQGVWLSSNSLDYWKEGTTDGNDEELLRPIMEEIIRQLIAQSSRGGNFAQHFHPWAAPTPKATG